MLNLAENNVLPVIICDNDFSLSECRLQLYCDIVPKYVRDEYDDSVVFDFEVTLPKIYKGVVSSYGASSTLHMSGNFIVDFYDALLNLLELSSWGKNIFIDNYIFNYADALNFKKCYFNCLNDGVSEGNAKNIFIFFLKETNNFDDFVRYYLDSKANSVFNKKIKNHYYANLSKLLERFV